MKTNLEFGMNIHRCTYSSYPAADLEKNIDACKELGMEIIRFNQTCYDNDSIEEVKKVSKLCHERGMKLMLCIDTRKFGTVESLEEIETQMADHYRHLSSVLRDKVDYYQLYNELDVYCMNGEIVNIYLTRADGKEKGEYDCVRWERSVAAVKGALRGMKEGYPEGKTCINFGWWHTAWIYELYKMGLRWDIVGIDWYSDCEEVSDIEVLMNDILQNIPDCDLMLCETNYWVNLHKRYTEERKAALKNTETRDELQAEWIPEYVEKLVNIDNPRFKGVIFYELLDETILEKDEYYGEAHFGFIACDANGQNRRPKPAFYSLKEKIKEIKGN